MGAGCALLDAPDVEGGRPELYLSPPKVDQFGRP
jgi:hypothetical protein